MNIFLIITIAGFIVWFVASRPKLADSMIADAGRLAFLVGLIFWCLSMAGVKVFG